MQKIARAALKRTIRQIVRSRAKDGEDQVRIKMPLKYLPEMATYLRSKGFTVVEDSVSLSSVKDTLIISW